MLLIWRGSVVRSIVPQLAIVLVISILAVWMHGEINGHQIPITVMPFTLLGVSLAIFLGFRNSASYERYWEARRLWGDLLNSARSIVRQSLSLAHLETEDLRTQELLSLLAATIHGLKHQLRSTDPTADFERYLPVPLLAELAGARFRPAILTASLGRWIEDRQREGLFGEVAAAAIDTQIGVISNVVGGCERIANTPLPYPYSVMTHRTVYIYCFLLPFGLVGSTGLLTPVLAVLVAYTFLALEALAQEIEDPFGTSENDLPLEYMAWSIEATLREMCGQSASLPPNRAQEWVLL